MGLNCDRVATPYFAWLEYIEFQLTQETLHIAAIFYKPEQFIS